MRPDGISFFDLASQRLAWLSESQRVVSENVANADTPGFRAQTTSEFSEMLSTSRMSGLAVTDARHIQGNSATGPGAHHGRSRCLGLDARRQLRRP
jgi:flagellar basal-body rod protein FlgB